MFLFKIIFILFIPIVFSFYKKTPKNLFFRRGFLSKFVDNLYKEICEPTNVSLMLLNMNDHDSLQLLYTLSSVYFINYTWNEEIKKKDKTKLNKFIDYKYGKKVAYKFILILNVIFIKNVNNVY